MAILCRRGFCGASRFGPRCSAVVCALIGAVCPRHESAAPDMTGGGVYDGQRQLRGDGLHQKIAALAGRIS